MRNYRQDLQTWHPIKSIKYTSQDITSFSIILSDFQYLHNFGNEAGIFLYQLINNCNEKEFTIITDHLSKTINYLGSWNTKIITIKGNAGKDVGHAMKGGAINLDGNYEEISWAIKGGNIYHKGKLIVKDGKRL